MLKRHNTDLVECIRVSFEFAFCVRFVYLRIIFSVIIYFFFFFTEIIDFLTITVRHEPELKGNAYIA